MSDAAIDTSSLIGGTPLLRLGRLEAPGTELYGKLEQYNPGGSVKDRIAAAMIDAAEKAGEIAPDRTTIIEATSGNTGIGLAVVCAAKGYALRIFMPQGLSREREALLRLYGASVELIESRGGMNEAVEAAQSAASEPDTWMPDQFSNPANPEIHRTTTGPEILEALGGALDVFVAGVGTGGTITGVGQALRAALPDVRIVAVEPAGSPVLSGGRRGPHAIQGIGAGFVPAVLDRSVIDEVVTCTDLDAIAAAHAAATSGLLVGMSAGAALWAARMIGERDRTGRIVAMVPDSGERYVSAPFFAPAPIGESGSQ